MNKTALFSMAVSLGLASLSVNAARPQTIPSAMDMGVLCICHWGVDPGCSISWKDTGARDYGVHIEFKAKWIVDGVDMSSVAKLNLDDNWFCDTTNMCSASGEFVLPKYPDNAAVAFDSKVKAFGSGPDGVTPRNFSKQTEACNLPEYTPSEDDDSFGDGDTVIIYPTQF